MLLLIDNYDSFSFNLYQLIGTMEPDIRVVRNDELTVLEIEALSPHAIIISPGPGRPQEAGVCEEVVRQLTGKVPILGVCLGHQAICETFGATVTYAKRLMHGKPSQCELDVQSPIFQGLPAEIQVARYHSLAVVEETLPAELQVIAHTTDGEVMAVAHRDFPVYGLQFHPESIMTPKGKQILRNFLKPLTIAEEAVTLRATEDGETLPVNETQNKCEVEEKQESGGITRGTASMLHMTPPLQTGETFKSEITRDAIRELILGRNLSCKTMKAVMGEIMNGNATEIQIAAFLSALAEKGETVAEIVACAEFMRERAQKISPTFDVMDLVGTGGDIHDGFGTINISTTACFVVAAGGVAVAKHGNRAVSSRSGAADVLENLGLNITLPAEVALENLRRFGFCFLFAPQYHYSCKAMNHVRRTLEFRTIFNILGPLTNPAGASRQLMGVYSSSLVEPLAHVLANLGVRRGMVVHGNDGLDEATTTDGTQICEVCEDGTFDSRVIFPEDFGLKRAQPEELRGGTAAENAEILRDILNGHETGAKRDIVALNAGLALYLGGKATTMRDGVGLALGILESGKAGKLLEKMLEEKTHDFI